MPWHITPAENQDRIMRGGLTPSFDGGKPLDRTYLSFEDLEAAIAAIGDEGERFSVLHVAGEEREGAWAEIGVVPPADISIITNDAAVFVPSPAHRALDSAQRPIDDVESFRATAVEMTAGDYGDLIRDAAFKDDPEAMVRVYAATYFIENLGNGNFGLLLERDYFVGNGDTGLAHLEEKLLDWARSERGLSPEPASESDDLSM